MKIEPIARVSLERTCSGKHSCYNQSTLNFIYKIPMSEIILTDQSFEQEVLQANEPVLVDFWAPWCGPCKILGPIVEEIAKEQAGKGVKIAKMNVDDNPDTPSKYGVMSIPTLILFKNGKIEHQMIGVQDKNTIIAELDKVRG